MTTQTVLDALKNVTHCGAGWKARCPAHEDQNPSLSITEKDGKILLHCHAGCSNKNVLAAIGLKMSDLSANCQPKISATYDYTDESGKLLFQTIRYEPKDFRQRHPDPLHRKLGFHG